MLYLRHEICLWSYFHLEQKQTDEDLVYSTGNSTQYSVMGEESEKEWICVYVQLSNFVVHLKLT